LDNNGIWYKGIHREELVEIIDGAPVSAKVIRAFRDLPLSSSQIIAYWKDDPRGGSTMPSGIVVPSGDVEDFIAWVATYLPLRPFTAYCRILDPAVIEFFSDAHPISFIPSENCFLGIILAECAIGLGDLEGITRLSLVECAGTLSFCLTRAVALGVHNRAADWIESRWEKAQILIPNGKRFNSRSLVSRVVRLVCALDGLALAGLEDDQIILRCAQDIVEHGEIRVDNWSNLTNWNPQLSRYLEIHTLPRESRIQLLRRVAESSWNERDPRLAFVVGYLGSAVAPGTFDHYRTVLEFESKFNGALLWYGFCAGLYRKGSLQLFSEGLGRRVARELERPDSMYSRPYCDVAISELEVLLRAPKPGNFNSTKPGTIEIELGPCVTTLRSFAGEQQTRRPEELNKLLRELDYKLQDLGRLRSRIERAIRVPEQPSLYTEPPRARQK
jgi:hypothetical protein